MVKSGSYLWYMEPTFIGWDYTHSWTVAKDFKSWLLNSKVGYVTAIWDYNSSTSNPTPPNDSANLSGGEVISYDWESDGIYTHSGFSVGYGKDPNSGIYGDLTDQHSTDRYHAIWHLKPYNAKWSTTSITGIKINSTIPF